MPSVISRNPIIYRLGSNVSVHRRRLVRRTVERLVGIYVLAVHALDLSEIVAARSMLFAGGWWRIHFTCGSPYILIPTSAFTFAPLVARNGGTPCWVPFSLAVPGFALPNRFRGVRDLCFIVVEGPLCARLPIYPDPTSALRLRHALVPITSNALLAPIFIGCSWPRSPKSFPRGRRTFHRG